MQKWDIYPSASEGLCPPDPLLFCFHPFGNPENFFLPTPLYYDPKCFICMLTNPWISGCLHEVDIWNGPKGVWIREVPLYVVVLHKSTVLVRLFVACRVLHFCKTNKNNDRKFYHRFVSGVLTSFFGTYLQGSSSLLKFITQRSLIPTPLGLFNTDTTCMQKCNDCYWIELFLCLVLLNR